MKLFAALGFLLLSSAPILASAVCTTQHMIMDETSFQSISGVNGCMMTLSPRDSNDMTYRSFLIQDSGMFMVFNSLGNGPENTSAGAREFFFYPRSQEMDFKYDAAAKQVSITGPSGKVFVFNTQKTILVSITGADFKVDYDINANNAGGIEITKNDGFYLDAGFKLGQSPTQNPSRKIAFRDAAGNSCLVKNSEVFKYTADQDVTMKFNDAQTKTFLARRCKNLKL